MFTQSSSFVGQARSADGGRTWPLHEQVVAFTPEDGLAGIDVQASHIVLLLDYAVGPHLVRSADAGTTWSSPAPIATAVVVPSASSPPRLHADGSTLVVAWTDDRPSGRVFTKRSADGGVTWQPFDTALDAGLVPHPGAPATHLHVAGRGSVVHVVWTMASIVGPVTFHQRSLDGGLTWRPAPVTVAMAPLARVATDGTNVVVADVQGVLRRSADGGDTWGVVSNAGIARVSDVAASGTTFAIAGQVNSWPLALQCANVSTDGGQTWQQPLQTPTSLYVFPQVGFGAGLVYVHYPMATPFVGVLATADAGASWFVIPGPLGGGLGSGPRRNVHLALTEQAGVFRYHAYVAVGGTPLGVATVGTGGVAPRLTNVGLPLQGHTASLQVDLAIGGSVGAFGISFAPPVAVALGSAIVWPTTAPILLALATSGTPGAAGAGSASRTLVVPVDPALVGASFITQALLADAGAADGFTVTNALEVWLR